MDFKSLQLHVFAIVTLFKFLLVTNGSTDICEPNTFEIRPPRVVVKYGNPFSATCTIKEKTDVEKFKWELSQKHTASGNGTVIDLMVQNAASWEMAPICYITTVNGSQCTERLDITLYQPPDSVSISYSNHSGPMDEGGHYMLQCDVKNIAPVRNLLVTFYRGHEVIFTAPPSSDSDKEPVTHTSFVNITARRGDNGAQYWCEAELMLGEGGPQPPPVVRSHNLTATVHYKPTIGSVSNTVFITEGDILHLNCSSMGNPPPQYNWSLPSSVHQTSDNNDNASLIIHKVVTRQSGNYTCRATNIKGQDERIFIVDIRVDLLPVFAGLAAAGALLLLVIGYCIYYTRYRHNHIGHYALTDVFRFRNNNLVAQPNGI